MSSKGNKICSKYEILVNVLDDICNSAPSRYSSYHLKGKSEEEINKHRSLAYIHLFLLVKFGVQDFVSRAEMITDGIDDGGIDAYYVDNTHKVIYIIQSKFRMTEDNYQEKEIDPTEIIAMELRNILKGNKNTNYGKKYNGKILAMQRRISNLENRALYNIKIILLANLNSKSKRKIVDNILSGFAYEVFDFNKAYDELLFPLCASTFYQGDKIIIDKNIMGITSVYPESFSNTSYGKCTIHMMFVPVVFIAEILDEYKNSILKYNPRNYLTMSNNPVNKSVAEGLNADNDDFALLNNGITMVCTVFKSTSLNGLIDSTNVYIEDPQIINGGQTGITLARLLKDNPQNLKGKKVLLKVIATYQTEKEQNAQEGEEREKLKKDYSTFIKAISDASNMQSKIEEADRRANLNIQYSFQDRIFKDYGLFYERKRGEFEEAMHKNIISKAQILNREKMLKCILAIQGDCETVMDTNKEKLFEETSFSKILNENTDPSKAVYAYIVYELTVKKNRLNKSKEPSTEENGTRYGKYALLTTLGCLLNENDLKNKTLEDIRYLAKSHLDALLLSWGEFEKSVSEKEENRSYFHGKEFNYYNYYKSKNVVKDIQAYWGDRHFDETNNIVVKHSFSQGLL